MYEIHAVADETWDNSPAFLFRVNGGKSHLGWAVGLGSDNYPDTVDCTGSRSILYSEYESIACAMAVDSTDCQWKQCGHATSLSKSACTLSSHGYDRLDWQGSEASVKYVKYQYNYRTDDFSTFSDDVNCLLSTDGHGCGENRTCVAGRCECTLGHAGDECALTNICAETTIMIHAIGNESVAQSCGDVCCGGGVNKCGIDGTCTGCPLDRHGDRCQYWSEVACVSAGLTPLPCDCDSVTWNSQCDIPQCWEFEPSSTDQTSVACGGITSPTVATAPPVFTVISGPCTTIDGGACFRSPNYPLNYDDNEDCTLTVSARTTVYSTTDGFDTESEYDYVSIDGREYDGSGGTLSSNGVAVSPDSEILWHTDGSETRKGVEICTSAAWSCAGSWCSSTHGGRAFRDCATAASSGYIVDATTGRCIDPGPACMFTNETISPNRAADHAEIDVSTRRCERPD
jgi:hypothetical protein